ncbi:unnamed protein product, partial [marine sediment metagenome]
MTETQRKAAAICAISELLSTKPLSDSLVDMYVSALDDLSAAEVEKAAHVAMRTLKFMPRPVELRELAGRGQPNLEDRALLAWGAVLRAINDGANSYDHVDFDDRAINATIRGMGGWPELLERGGADFDVWARKE